MIKLPPLPRGDTVSPIGAGMWVHSDKQMLEYGRLCAELAHPLEVRMFPIMRGNDIPWSVIEPFDKRAYFEDGKMSEYFHDADGRDHAKVPKRFINEAAAPAMGTPLRQRLSEKNHLVYVADPLSSTGCRGVFVDDICTPWWWAAGLVYCSEDAAAAHALTMRTDSQRLGHLQATGSTVEVVAMSGAWAFRVGGVIEAVNGDIRKAIDAAIKIKVNNGV